MTRTTDDTPFHQRLIGWRIAGWSTAAALLALPAIAMQFSDEVDWTTGDFAMATVILLITGLAAEGGLRLARSWQHLIGFALAIFAAFFTVWSNLAVGIIGDEDASINPRFFTLLAMAIVASILLRFRPRAMATITGILAVSQLALGLAAQRIMPGHDVEWGVLALLAALWFAASLSFHSMARAEARTEAMRNT